MAWDIKARKTVDYELWTSCEDSNGAEFKRDFQETALKLIDVAHFTPRYYIYDGIALQCNTNYDCGNQCISGGLYCGPDPDKNLAAGVSGSDVVNENLRQICIWEDLTSKVANGLPRSELMKWWCYVNDFANKCFNGDGAMESGETFAKCGDDVMKSHALDESAVDKCVTDSYLSPGGANTMLHQEIVDRADYGVLKLPEAVVNGVVLRGQTSYGATLELNVAQAICNGFLEGPPAVCKDIIHPDGSLGQDGKAVVNLQAELGYLSGAGLETAALSDVLINRFRSTMGLKLGVEPQAMIISLSTDEGVTQATNKVVVDIKINNLKCSTGEGVQSASDKVVESLKGVGTCSAEASSDVAVESETAVGTTFYFHTSIAHSSQNRQIKATVTKMTADETGCPAPAGLGAGWVVLIVILVCTVFFGAFFVFWRQRMQRQMRDEVKAILAEYMPLDDVAGGEGADARMLDGGMGSSSMDIEGRI
jgi:hypothetical protein